MSRQKSEKNEGMKFNEGGAVYDAGNSLRHKTGEWRTFRPVVDHDKCTGCGICVKFCPDNCLKLVDTKGKKKIVIDYDYCKGCLICVTECPFKAYTTERERRSDTNTCDFKKEGFI
jgi:pyruvate ferredoxin oxidoreductase delta subunit